MGNKRHKPEEIVAKLRPSGCSAWALELPSTLDPSAFSDLYDSASRMIVIAKQSGHRVEENLLLSKLGIEEFERVATGFEHNMQQLENAIMDAKFKSNSTVYRWVEFKPVAAEKIYS